MRLDDYVQRLGVPAPDGASAETLRALHAAHREAFLFENLTIQAGGQISLAVGDLERKFLDERRGGYCFEHNTLFAAALREMDIDSTTLLGRVRRGPPHRWCRTHMVLRIALGREVWLADVGFGALGLLEPLPLRDGATATQGGFTFRLRRDGGLWILSARDADAEMDLYEFSDDPQTVWDVEVANHFTSTHPESIFRKTLTIQRTEQDRRTILRGEVLTRYRGGKVSEQPVGRPDMSRVAMEEFGVELPSGPFVYEAVA
ncbi:MAG TPA: arylamine N-acetyltransferase [Vicinamibacterales bacterium]|nr:arylamine N-acetyltransferase [Vicinamibacterales bacterium]